MHGERGDQFRLAPSFKAEMKLLACIDNLFDDFAQLIDLNRKDATIFVAITKLRHRGLKRAVDRVDAVPQQVLKSDHQRKSEVPGARFVNDLEKVDGTAAFLQRPRLDVA